MCDKKDDHKNACLDCSLGFGIIIEINEAITNINSVNLSPMERSQLHNDVETINECKDNLDVLRSHLSRHYTESVQDSLDLANLDDSTAIVTADFKNNILDCMFRENMQKFFGKNGTTDLGFMVVMKDPDSSQLEGTFFHFISDDKFKDHQFVISAKYELYTKHLPQRIKKVQYRSDGAANLCATLHYLIQPLWEVWTGIMEEICKHCPNGDGKSELDGNFGIVSHRLQSQHNLGFSYNGMVSIVNALTGNDAGISGTTYASFMPGRDLTITGKLETEMCGKAVLRSELQKDGSLITFQHAGYGSGTRIVPPLHTIEIKNAHGDIYSPIDAFKSPKRDSVKDVFAKLLSEFYGSEQISVLCMWWQWGARQLIIAALASFKPSSKEYTLSTTARSNIPTKISEAGVGGGNEIVRQVGRISRAEYKKQSYENQLQLHRGALLRKDVYSCSHRCPRTNRYCSKQFLNRKYFEKHVARRKCTFQQGISSCDRLIYSAVQPGSTLCVGSHYNRGHKTSLFKPIVEAPIGHPGSAHAKCFGKCHRPKDKKQYHKPARLLLELKKLFDTRPVLTAFLAFGRLSLLRAVDGSALFDYSKRGEISKFAKTTDAYKRWAGCSMCHRKPCSECTGKLLKPDEIKTYFSSLATKRKQNAVEPPPGLQTREQALMSLLAVTLRQKCTELGLPGSGTKAQLVVKIMEAEDAQMSHVNNIDETLQSIDENQTVNL